jgi:hypothetical protein
VKPFEATQRRHASVPAVTFGSTTAGRNRFGSEVLRRSVLVSARHAHRGPLTAQRSFAAEARRFAKVSSLAERMTSFATSA